MASTAFLSRMLQREGFRMAFILSAQREPETVVSAFKRYREYLTTHATVFPRGALALASSDWYFDPRDHRCPHDAWLEDVTISGSEPAVGGRKEKRGTTIRVRLLGAYHDGCIEPLYRRVLRYSLSASSSAQGIGDWLYDEFLVAPGGHVIHEIEWAGLSREEGSRWIIEASDVEFEWIPEAEAKADQPACPEVDQSASAVNPPGSR